ncbi:PilI type IV pilus biogenesis protein, partial [Escherichia coli]
MPQQHPGRLQILVVDAHCKRRLFSTKTPTDPDELARRFCTVQLLLFPFRKESLMPQQHPGRLQILVVDAHCK